MKKLLVLLALCMVISVVLVACQEEPEQPVDSSNAETTVEPGTTEPGTTEPGTETTEPGTETTEPDDTSETTPPPPPPADPVITGISFDQLYKGTGAAANGEENIFAPGTSSAWDGIAAIDHTVDYLTFWGWVGFFAENVGEFGYQIGDADPVFSAEFAFETEQGVIDAAANGGAKSASRMKIMIPVYQLGAGNTTVKTLAKDAAGTVEVLKEFTITKTLPFATDLHSGFSVDELKLNGAAYAPEGQIVPTLQGMNNTVTVAYGQPLETLWARGWAALKDAPATEFGYYVGYKYEIITSADNCMDRPDLAGAGIVNGVGYSITISIEGLEPGYYPVGLIAKTADGSYAQFWQFTLYVQGPAEDTTNTFKSDVDSNDADTVLGSTDLAGIMQLRPGTNGAWSVVETDGVKYYSMSGIDAITADMNGAYYFKTNIIKAQNGSGIGFVVRGYNSTISSDENVQYKITNFYETDGIDFCGGSGIYAYTTGSKLNIYVKYYNPENGTRVGNKRYSLPCEGMELTMADDGYNVYIMVDGVTYATIALSGSVAYEDITTTPAGEFATKAVVTLKDGTTETIENTLVAATSTSQIGITCRASQLQFSYVEVGGFSAIEVPALEIVNPEPVDPNAPAAIGDAKYLADAAKGGNHVASAVLSEDGKYVTITSTDGGDPNFFVLPGGSAITSRYLAIKYRTTYVGDGGQGEIFAGSVSISGSGDTTRIDYQADGEWHVVIIDLSTIPAVNDQYLINYVRYDFFTGAKNATIDVESVALFTTEKAAHLYYGLEAPKQEVPYHVDETVVIGTRGDGAPFTGAPNKTFGQKISLGETFLKKVTINDLATYSDGNVNTWSFKVWAWNDNYSKTVAGAPLFEIIGENHQDNASFVVEIPAELMIDGTIYYELAYLTGSGTFTGWPTAEANPNVDSYVEGELRDNDYAASIVVGVPTEEPTTEPLTIDLAGKAFGKDSWDAAGYTTPIIQLGYGNVSALGELNLTAYNTITIKYSYDGDNTRGDGRTPEQCFTDSSITPIIGFTAIEKCFGYANVVNQDAIDAGIYTEIELSSGCWAGATRTAVIDISALEYNGPCYLSVFNPWGTEVVISEIVLA